MFVKTISEVYKGKIVHFIGGIHEYVGELDTKTHPNGTGWFRLLNPCFYMIQKKGQDYIVSLLRLWNVDKAYERYVDLFIPADSLVEIRELDETGQLYKSYKTELSKPSLDLIVAPTGEDLRNIKKLRR